MSWLALLIVCLANAVVLPQARANPGGPRRTEVGSLTPWLGVSIEKGPRGALVREVIPEGPADFAGVMVGDDIIQIESTKVESPHGLVATVRAFAVGQKVRVALIRAGHSLSLSCVLTPALDDNEVLQRRLVGKAAPRFRLSTEQGWVDLDQLRGKVIVLNFMATWCHACKSTYPALASLQNTAPDDVAVVGVSWQPDEVLRSFRRQSPPGFLVARDPNATMKHDYRVSKTPTLIVISRDGTIGFAGVGSGDTLQSAVRFVRETLALAPR